MISRVMAADLPRHVGEHVRIAGWVHRMRELKSVTFLVVRDRSGLAQAVLTGPVGVGEETVVEVHGLVTANDKAPGGAEITDPVITESAPPPFDLYRPHVIATLPT
ncbi:MAG TPA: OB-fold nucleic acid binding domain-containing protein, partial [Umezawaea sp.]|nr:OB-fold nucleic acid binding domain-containing protein [Umezawaea sp.]